MIGLPFNPGAEGGIQNAALDGQDCLPYTRGHDEDPGTSEATLYTGVPNVPDQPVLFKGDDPDGVYLGAFDISGYSSVSLMVDINFGTATGFDIIPIFVDKTNFKAQDVAMGGPGYAYLGTFTWTLVSDDSILTVRKTIFRIPGDLVPVIFSFPVPNAKYMMLRGKAIGGTIDGPVICVGRGYNTGVGLVPMR